MTHYKTEPNSADQHIAQITTDTCEAIESKYLAGQEEHGGRLWRKPVLDFMGEEVTDMNTYFHVLKHQHYKMKLIAQEGLQDACNAKAALKKIYNVLTIGNPEGQREAGD